MYQIPLPTQGQATEQRARGDTKGTFHNTMKTGQLDIRRNRYFGQLTTRQIDL